MATLRSGDYRKLLEAIGALNAPCCANEFPARAIAVVSQLVASDHTAYNEVNLAQGRIVGAIAEGSPPASTMAALLEPHLGEHPLVSRCAHGEITLGAISDFFDATSWHRTALYNEFYRCFEIEDQLALCLDGEAGALIAVTLHRSNRSFSPRDRELLRLFRAHLNNAHAMMCALNEAENFAQSDASRGHRARGYALVGDAQSLVFCDSRARALLLEFWSSDVLPDELRAWLSAGARSLLCAPTFQMRRHSRVLTIYRGARTPAGTLIVFEESAPALDPLRALQQSGLTARQSEVALCLARGDSNAQIAARLHLSLHTVKRHLETIYARLEVENRVAAAHRVLQILGESRL